MHVLLMTFWLLSYCLFSHHSESYALSGPSCMSGSKMERRGFEHRYDALRGSPAKKLWEEANYYSLQGWAELISWLEDCCWRHGHPKMANPCESVRRDTRGRLVTWQWVLLLWSAWLCVWSSHSFEWVACWTAHSSRLFLHWMLDKRNGNIGTHDNIADVFTKALPIEVFAQHWKALRSWWFFIPWWGQMSQAIDFMFALFAHLVCLSTCFWWFDFSTFAQLCTVSHNFISATFVKTPNALLQKHSFPKCGPLDPSWHRCCQSTIIKMLSAGLKRPSAGLQVAQMDQSVLIALCGHCNGPQLTWWSTGHCAGSEHLCPFHSPECCDWRCWSFGTVQNGGWTNSKNCECASCWTATKSATGKHGAKRASSVQSFFKLLSENCNCF